MGFLDSLKNLFGSAKAGAETAHDIAGDVFNQAKEAAAPLIEKVEAYTEVAKEKVNEYAPAASEALENGFETAKEKVSEFADKAELLAADVIETIKEKYNDLTADKTADEATDKTENPAI